MHWQRRLREGFEALIRAPFDSDFALANHGFEIGYTKYHLRPPGKLEYKQTRRMLFKTDIQVDLVGRD
jgi:hypothetical protein